MDVRQKINQKQGFVIAMAVTLIVLSLLSVMHFGRQPRSGAINRFMRFYTDDDGKSLFTNDDSNDIAPFDHNGQEAVGVCFIPGGKPTPEGIWYLTKWTERAKKRMEEPHLTADPSTMPPPGSELIKRPGDAVWVPSNDPKAAAIMALPHR